MKYKPKHSALVKIWARSRDDAVFLSPPLYPTSTSGFTNVYLQKGVTKYTLRPFMIRPHLFRSMPSDCTRAYTSAAHAALVIARHKAAVINLDA